MITTTVMTLIAVMTNSAVFAGIVGDNSTTTPFLFLSVTSLILHATQPAIQLVSL